MTFTLVAKKVGVITLRVTATADLANGATVTDTVQKTLIVKVRKDIIPEDGVWQTAHHNC